MDETTLPLTIFTLAIQFSVGTVLLYDLFLLFPLMRIKTDIPFRYKWIMLIAALMTLIGLVASLFHLGNPTKSYLALSNLGTSWLSREILFVLIYSILVFFLALIQFRNPSPERKLKWLIDLTAVIGLVLLYVMSRIYQLDAKPAWNSIFTPVGFYLSSLALGSGFILMFQLNRGSWASQKTLAILIIAIPVIQLGILPLEMTWLGQAGDTARQTLGLMLEGSIVLFILRLAFQLLTIGFGLWALFSIRSDITRNRYLFIPVIAAFIFIMAAQVADRLLFYIRSIPSGGL